MSIGYGPLLLLLFVPATAQAEEILFTPDAYIRAVLQASPETRRAEEGHLSASAQWRSELAAKFAPALTFNGTMTPAKLARGGRFTLGAWRGAANDFSLTPGASWSLFNSFQDALSVRSKRLDRDISREDLQGIRQTRALEAVRTYFTMMLREKLLEVANENLKAQRAQYDLTQDRYKHGMKSLSDLLKTETDWRSAELDVETAEAERRLALFKFNVLIDRAEDAPAHLEADLSIGTTVLPAIEEGMRLALRNRPEILKDRLSRKKADTAFQLAFKQTLPTLALDLDMTHPVHAAFRSPTDSFGAGTAVYGLTLTLSLPSAFNFYSQRQDLIAARASLQISHEDTRILERSVREEVYRAQINLSRAIRSYQISLRKEEISKQNYEIVSEQYSQGSADVIRLSQALVDYVRAQRERMRAYTDSKTNRAEYLQAVGEPIWR